jgi:hypothetical protein
MLVDSPHSLNVQHSRFFQDFADEMGEIEPNLGELRAEGDRTHVFHSHAGLRRRRGFCLPYYAQVHPMFTPM